LSIWEPRAKPIVHRSGKKSATSKAVRFTRDSSLVSASAGRAS
jgi:hypothetical protein